MERKGKETSEKSGFPVMTLMKCLLAAYLLTGVLLMVLAFLLLQLGLSEKAVSAVIIGVYVGACFLAGFLAGRVLKTRKFIWGFLEGLAYFVILALISLAVNSDTGGLGNGVMTTLVLCCGGGTLGGMLS